MNSEVFDEICIASRTVSKCDALKEKLKGKTAIIITHRPKILEICDRVIDFAGDHCEATSAMYSHQAKAVWDFSRNSFPSKALGALCTGRPAVVSENKINREYLTSGTYFLKSFSENDINSLYTEIEGSFLSQDRRALRRLGLKWNERLFKSRMVKFLDKNE